MGQRLKQPHGLLPALASEVLAGGGQNKTTYVSYVSSFGRLVLESLWLPPLSDFCNSRNGTLPANGPSPGHSLTCTGKLLRTTLELKAPKLPGGKPSHSP